MQFPSIIFKEQYLKLVKCLRINDIAFYFQTFSDTFQLKNIPLEVHGLNKIVPSLFFFEEANKSLFTRLFNENKKEELIRAQTGNIPQMFRSDMSNRIGNSIRSFERVVSSPKVMFLLRMKHLKIKSITMSGENCQALFVAYVSYVDAR